MTSSSEPSRRNLLVGAGVGAAAVAIGAHPCVRRHRPRAVRQQPHPGGPAADPVPSLHRVRVGRDLRHGPRQEAVRRRRRPRTRCSSRTTTTSTPRLRVRWRGVGAVGTNGQMVNAYTGRVRTANTVDALFDVLFELESRAASTYLLACGTYVAAASGGLRRSCALDRGTARHRARLSGELAYSDLDPRLRVDRRSVPTGRVPGAGMSDMGMGRDELRRQMRDAAGRAPRDDGRVPRGDQALRWRRSGVQPTWAARCRWRGHGRDPRLVRRPLSEAASARRWSADTHDGDDRSPARQRRRRCCAPLRRSRSSPCRPTRRGSTRAS